jgi:hypothetical protein
VVVHGVTVVEATTQRHLGEDLKSQEGVGAGGRRGSTTTRGVVCDHGLDGSGCSHLAWDSFLLPLLCSTNSRGAWRRCGGRDDAGVLVVSDREESDGVALS